MRERSEADRADADRDQDRLDNVPGAAGDLVVADAADQDGDHQIWA